VAIELVMRNWCDVCLEAGANTEGETVSVVVTGTPAFDVEACPEHAEALRTAVAALAAVGRRPAKGAQPGAAGPSAGNVALPKADQRTGTGGTCPVCGYTHNTRAALRTHIRKAHDQSLADVGLAPVKYTCPNCGSKFDGGQGFASHLRLIHGTTMTDAMRTEQAS
jgi:predicted RNA-binding Zn-ribbon protein involved in translation (DUF1610 family)